MKILCSWADAGPSYVNNGIGRVFKALGHDFRFWDMRAPAFDVFGEFEPDLFLGRTFEADRAVSKCIANRPHMKVVMYASAWGRLVDEIDLKKYPIAAISDEEKRRLDSLKKLTGKPDFVWLHLTDTFTEPVLGGWRSIGIEPVGLLNAADTFALAGARFRAELASQIAFIGGYWGYKAQNLDKFLVPLCHPSKGLQVKIFGNQPWPVPQYLGFLEDGDAKDVFVSAQVCPNVSEPHSTDFGFDIVERPFKVLASGTPCVSDYVESMKEVFGDTIPLAKTPQAFESRIRDLLADPTEASRLAAEGQKLVLAKHTYFHRVSKMLALLGMMEEAHRVMEYYERKVFPCGGELTRGVNL